MKKQKAIIIEQHGEPKKVMKFKEIDVPKIKDNEVLVKIQSTGLNPADWKIMKGFFKLDDSRFPICPGFDLSGEIIETGKDVKNFKNGDLVMAFQQTGGMGEFDIYSGTYCQYAAVKENLLSKNPKSLSIAESAAIPVAALTAFEMIYDKGKISKDDRVIIVNSAGGVGSFALQFLNDIGCESISICSKESFDFVKKLGAKNCVDYHGDYESEIKKIFKNGATVVLDCQGTADLYEKFVVDGGRIVSIAAFGFKPTNEKIQFFAFGCTSKGENLIKIAKMIDDKKVKVIISKQYDWTKIEEATEEIMKGHVKGKIVVNIKH